MLMPGRRFSNSTYRYGFNGKENDNDIKGEGNEQDYGMRIYDSRIGKFLSVDPVANSFSWLTPYQFSGNIPTSTIDLDGLEPFQITLPRSFPRLQLPEIYVPPPPTIPWPSILIPKNASGVSSEEIPTSVQPTVPEWADIDISKPGVIKIPEADIEFVPEPIYQPKWLENKIGKSKTASAY